MCVKIFCNNIWKVFGGQNSKAELSKDKEAMVDMKILRPKEIYVKNDIVG